MNSSELYLMEKDFRKVIGKLRKEEGRDVPKAMMNGQQVVNSTATVNCGFGADRSLELANKVLADDRFKAFLKKYGAVANVEKNPEGKYQVRIHY